MPRLCTAPWITRVIGKLGGRLTSWTLHSTSPASFFRQITHRDAPASIGKHDLDLRPAKCLEERRLGPAIRRHRQRLARRIGLNRGGFAEFATIREDNQALCAGAAFDRSTSQSIVIDSGCMFH